MPRAGCISWRYLLFACSKLCTLTATATGGQNLSSSVYLAYSALNVVAIELHLEGSIKWTLPYLNINNFMRGLRSFKLGL